MADGLAVWRSHARAPHGRPGEPCLQAERLSLRHMVNSRSTARYLQEAGAPFAYARVPPEARARVEALAAATPAALCREIRRVQATQ